MPLNAEAVDILRRSRQLRTEALLDKVATGFVDGKVARRDALLT
jgi:hypothetical protein